MESQGDLLMRRKMERDGVATAAHHSVPTIDSNGHAATHGASPGAIRIGTASHSPVRPLHLPTLGSGRSHLSAAPVSTLPPYQRHLHEREKELHDYIRAQMQAAVQEQRREEANHADACRRQRDVERMKLRQRTKHRIELQASAKQPVPAHLVETMEIQLPEDTHLSATAEHRRGLRDVPTTTYLEHNADRLTTAALHREACREAERIKAQARVALEEYVGTGFAKKRMKLWEQNSGRPTDSVRCPTAEERQRNSTRVASAKKTKHDEEEEVRRAVNEVSLLDDAVYTAEAERRALPRGQKTLRKDVAFDINAPFKRTVVH
jgi:hypothetical protein